jgi:hypothetical protein
LPIDAVYQKQRVAFLDSFLRDARTRAGGKPIVREDFVYELMNRAAVPRGYALIADQTPPRDGKKHWSRFPQSRHGVFRRRGEGRALSSIRRCCTSRCAASAAALFGAPASARDAAVRRGEHDTTPIMERFARMLEAAVRESPADWLWLQKRWKYPRTDEHDPEPRRRAHGANVGTHRRAVTRGSAFTRSDARSRPWRTTLREPRLLQRPIAGNVRRRARAKPRRSAELDFESPERRDDAVAGGLAHRLLARPVVQETAAGASR